MKIQDFGFFVVLILLLISRNPRLPAMAGIISLALAIPLFALWVFFTAERLTWYAAAFLFLSTLFYIAKTRKNRHVS